MKVTITWIPDDIKTLRPGWSDAECVNFLGTYAKVITDRSIEMGWSVIEDCLHYDRTKGEGLCKED